MINKDFWANKRVLITGHTGFKGSWLSIWLNMIGAEVYGLSLSPLGDQSLFSEITKSISLGKNYFVDIRNKEKLKKSILEINPEIVFHLAAQPLVRDSYKNPLDTWSTNLMGSLNLLETLANLKKICAVIMITTDKVYKNREWEHGYRENDELGGYDPYSASKAACEIAISSWRNSYCDIDKKGFNLAIASARSGNVIGGGDWAKDRIIPDTIRAFKTNNKLLIRNPNATRPWQHVLEPLSGYLLLAENLYNFQKVKSNEDVNVFATAFNFGPYIESNKTVKKLLEEIIKSWPNNLDIKYKKDILHEAGLLNLQIDKAYQFLQWNPKWTFEKTVSYTINWYKNFHENKLNAYRLCVNDVEIFMN